MRLDRAESLDVDGALVAHPGEVVADQVHDHDVLGDVLGEEAVGCRRRPLDR